MLKNFIKIALLLTIGHVAAFSTSTSSTDIKVAQLVPQLVIDQNIPELTSCISALAELKYTNEDMLETLIQNSPWKATFAMAPNQQGRFLPFGELTIEENTIEQFIDLNILKFCFQGKYEMSENKMNIEFTSLDVCLLGWDFPTLDISNDSKVVRYARGGGGAGRKRPNTYLWHFVNEDICVARGSSGKVAMWQSKKSVKSLNS